MAESGDRAGGSVCEQREWGRLFVPGKALLQMTSPAGRGCGGRGPLSGGGRGAGRPLSSLCRAALVITLQV